MYQLGCCVKLVSLEVLGVSVCVFVWVRCNTVVSGVHESCICHIWQVVIETVHCFYVVRVSTSEVMIVGGEDWLSIDHVHGSRSVRRCCNKFCDTRIKNTVNMACHVTHNMQYGLRFIVTRLVNVCRSICTKCKVVLICSQCNVLEFISLYICMLLNITLSSILMNSLHQL